MIVNSLVMNSLPSNAVAVEPEKQHMKLARVGTSDNMLYGDELMLIIMHVHHNVSSYR